MEPSPHVYLNPTGLRVSPNNQLAYLGTVLTCYISVVPTLVLGRRLSYVQTWAKRTTEACRVIRGVPVGNGSSSIPWEVSNKLIKNMTPRTAPRRWVSRGNAVNGPTLVNESWVDIYSEFQYPLYIYMYTPSPPFSVPQMRDRGCTQPNLSTEISPPFLPPPPSAYSPSASKTWAHYRASTGLYRLRSWR